MPGVRNDRRVSTAAKVRDDARLAQVQGICVILWRGPNWEILLEGGGKTPDTFYASVYGWSSSLRGLQLYIRARSFAPLAVPPGANTRSAKWEFLSYYPIFPATCTIGEIVG